MYLPQDWNDLNCVMSSTGVSSLRLGPTCLPIGQRFGRTGMVSCSRWCPRCRPQPQCWLGKLGKRKSDTIFLSSPASATILSNFYVSIIFIFLFCRLDSSCVCLNAVKRWLACRGRGVQLLNYGGEDLSQEDLKIGTHVYFVDIMDGDVLSNTHTPVRGLGPFWY